MTFLSHIYGIDFYTFLGQAKLSFKAYVIFDQGVKPMGKLCFAE